MSKKFCMIDHDSATEKMFVAEGWEPYVAGYERPPEGVLYVLPGNSNDIPPHFYNQKKHEETYPIDAGYFELTVANVMALRCRKLPVVGICGGFQLLGVIEGLDLYQHLGYLTGKVYVDSGRGSVSPDDFSGDHHLEYGFDKDYSLSVSRDHHQGFIWYKDSPEEGLTITHTLPTWYHSNALYQESIWPLIYGFYTAYSKTAGVQWHPEWDALGSESRKEFFNLITRIY